MARGQVLLYLPSFLGPPRQEHEGCHCPDAKNETEHGPEIFGVAVVMGEQAAHDPVEKMDQ